MACADRDGAGGSVCSGQWWFVLIARGGPVVLQAWPVAHCSAVGSVVCTTVPVGPAGVMWAYRSILWQMRFQVLSVRCSVP